MFMHINVCIFEAKPGLQGLIFMVSSSFVKTSSAILQITFVGIYF